MEDYRKKSWFGRNWGWLLGGGCLMFIVVAVVVIGGLIYKVSDTIKESEPYTYAYDKAVKNEQVIEFLGTPIETNGMGNTSYKYSNGSTTVELTIPIKGPKDEGSIIVDAEKINDEWAYHLLYVKIDGETEAIDLLDTNIEVPLDNL
ncbi:cytochrome c oxidase assembly factor Coa1 family protein [uncultured Winogradskyella sp.]|uniref:cytochrome c oxidase assembly factor Coa1 family protein n=1 Tax=uncultured Winogradskyella sp. TaxID=395353 RepID=UPI0026155FEF|nr:cytochrome c oxidase assembly factor Coa1 family protein [uncultured Winogradskyella sp.]